MPKISVIVPIYNAEKYLERCVKSLIAQTFHDIEILLIDDGSTDASSILCARFKKEDSRIRFLHKPNGGLSSARNAGLLAASGAFIGFVDADDTVSPTFFETLLQKIEQYHCDFVFCDLIRIESGKPPTLRSASLHGGYYDKRKIKRCVFPQLIMRDDLEYGPLLSVCVCLYRTSFLKEHDLRFDETVRVQDTAPLRSFILRAKGFTSTTATPAASPQRTKQMRGKATNVCIKSCAHCFKTARNTILAVNSTYTSFIMPAPHSAESVLCQRSNKNRKSTAF